MDAFEENLQTFNSSIRGPEMKDSLYRCFSLLKTEIDDYSDKIQEVSRKIKELEEGGD